MNALIENGEELKEGEEKDEEKYKRKYVISVCEKKGAVGSRKS